MISFSVVIIVYLVSWYLFFDDEIAMDFLFFLLYMYMHSQLYFENAQVKANIWNLFMFFEKGQRCIKWRKYTIDARPQILTKRYTKFDEEI